jgi:hypothetical protein
LWFVRRARKTTEKRRDVRLRHIELVETDVKNFAFDFAR